MLRNLNLLGILKLNWEFYFASHDEVNVIFLLPLLAMPLPNKINCKLSVIYLLKSVPIIIIHNQKEVCFRGVCRNSIFKLSIRSIRDRAIEMM